MIVLGITTYNRLEVLQKSIVSLRNSKLPENCVIRVYDDCSTDFTREDLWKLIPEAEDIIVQNQNVGSDSNIWSMYRDFVKRNNKGDIFVNCDSDLIYSVNWLQEALLLFDRTDGVMSVFNSSTHDVLDDGNDDLIQKKDIGSAGTFFSWDVLDAIIKKYPVMFQGSFDYAWCRYLGEQGIRLLCSKMSLVQHIGINGYNSDLSKFDYGMGFDVSTVDNGQIINDVLENMSKSQSDKKRRFWYALFPFEQIKKGERVVLFGAGDVAHDYIQQIHTNNYCSIVAIIDNKYAGTERKIVEGEKVEVMPASFLKNHDLYDKIVISVREYNTAKSIIESISNIEKNLTKKAVFAGEGRFIHI